MTRATPKHRATRLKRASARALGTWMAALMAQLIAPFMALWMACAGAPWSAALAQGTQPTAAPSASTTTSAPALLVADDVLIEGEDRLVATGNVEALQGDTRLSATRIVYDRAGNLLTIEGPIRISDPEQGLILLADQAELDDGFRNGLMRGARMVLDQQLQMAAIEARRVNGRYTQMRKVAVTSCQVCGAAATPLWQIRASRVVHDQQERQIYFDDAQFRVLDVPVFYLPRLRMPDPSLKRARGFLFPTFTSGTLLGFGIKTPYFIPIGDHKDLTLTPHLTTKSKSLEFRYRQAFRKGKVTLTGAVSGDDFRDETLRGYLFAEGIFSLPRDYGLSVYLRSVSDNAYLNDYNILSADRLASTLYLSRLKRDRRMRLGIESYQTLRAFEANATQPGILVDFDTDRRFRFAALPGEFRLAAETAGYFRDSDLNVDSDDADTLVDGRDVARLNVEASWHDRWTLGAGLRAGVSAYVWADHFETRQDAAINDTISKLTPGASVELRWPWMRQGPQGGRTLIEPIMQVGWVGGERATGRDLNANEESTRTEFDEANLLSLSRFPAADRREHGATLAAGLRWMHRAPTGWSSTLTVGRLWRDDLDTAFSRSSGLDDKTSDWLIAGRFAHPRGLTLSARGLLDDAAKFNKAEARAGWSNARMDLGASYVLLVDDADEARSGTTSEWTFDGRYEVTRHWQTTTSVRYDLADNRLDRLGMGLRYRNECIQVDFGATRKFASATNLEPSTDFGLTVALQGFGGASSKEYRRTCR